MNGKLLNSLDDVDVVTDGSSDGKLGYGALSLVRKVRHKGTGKLFALKQMNLTAINEKDIQNINREITNHMRLDHPYIIKFHDYITQDGLLYLLLEYAEKGNLFYYIRKHDHLSEQEVHKYFVQTLQAIDYIHKHKIMHRDLKPENILLDKNLDIKVCDFGWCAEYSEEERRQTLCGTSEYMAPEILMNKPQDYSIDIWALGILLYEMFHKFAPFKGRNPIQIKKAIQKGTIEYTAPNMPFEARDLVSWILQIDAAKRPTMEEIFDHPFIKKHSFERYSISLAPQTTRPKTPHQTQQTQANQMPPKQAQPKPHIERTPENTQKYMRKELENKYTPTQQKMPSTPIYNSSKFIEDNMNHDRLQRTPVNLSNNEYREVVNHGTPFGGRRYRVQMQPTLSTTVQHQTLAEETRQLNSSEYTQAYQPKVVQTSQPASQLTSQPKNYVNMRANTPLQSEKSGADGVYLNKTYGFNSRARPLSGHYQYVKRESPTTPDQLEGTFYRNQNGVRAPSPFMPSGINYHNSNNEPSVIRVAEPLKPSAMTNYSYVMNDASYTSPTLQKTEKERTLSKYSYHPSAPTYISPERPNQHNYLSSNQVEYYKRPPTPTIRYKSMLIVIYRSV